MKKLFVISLCFILLSCKKEKYGSDLTGSWELTKVYSWLPVTTPPPGQTISFADNSFKRFTHDTLLYSGTYRIEKKKDCYTDRLLALVMDYGNGGTSIDYYEIKGDSLTLSSSSCVTDGSTSVYKKRP